MKSSIAKKISALVLLVTVGAFSSLGGFYWLYAQTVHDAHFINIAGRQRMFAQGMLALAARATQGHGESRPMLRESITAFQASLDLLERGGQVRDHRLPPAPLELRDQFAQVRRVWSEFEAPLRQFAEAPAGGIPLDAAYDQIVSKTAELTAASDRVVTAYEARSHRLHRYMLYMLAAVAGLSLVVLIGSFWLTKRYIAYPLLMLTDGVQSIQAGNLGHQVRVWAWDELATLVECFNDMSSRMAQLFARVQSSEQRYHNLVNGLDAIVWEQDPRTLQVTFISRQAETLLGYPEQRWLLEPELWQEIIHPDDREMVLARCGDVLAHRLPEMSLDYRAVAADGRVLHVHSAWRLALDSQGQAQSLRGMTIDVTEHKRIEEQLRQAHKMEAVGMLAGGVAHDFNNLLTVIQNCCALLLLRLEADHSARRYVEQVAKVAEKAGSLTRQLLAFSRRQPLTPKVLDLNATVAGVEEMLRRLIGEDIDLDVRLNPDLGRCRVDPGQIEQVILNLVANARAAMPQGGGLTIETANAELDEEYTSRHVGAQPGRYVQIAVRDTGHGMDAETQSRIFEPFFTTKSLGHGTGLGLSTVYGIVKQSGGNIWVYSEPGLGTTFKVYLPRVDEPAERPAQDLAGAQRLDGSETVLLVEDEETVRSLVLEVLEGSGYTVLEASDGAEALHICEQHPGPLDLVITDVIMPGMSGPDLAGRIAGMRPTAKVIYMSGYTNDTVAHHGALQPGIAFLEKPFTPDTLLRKVRGVLGDTM